MLTNQTNIERITSRTQSILRDSSKKAYAIIDGDRTLIPTDSTRQFFRSLDLDFRDIKAIFETHEYSFQAFLKTAEFYSALEPDRYETGCISSANAVDIYPEFLNFFEQVKHNVELLVITTGIKRIWELLLQKHSLHDVHLIAGTYLPTDNYVVDKAGKGIVAQTLLLAGKEVFAFGDSLVDLDMLTESHHPHLIVNERQNRDIIPFASNITNLQQISFSDFEHSEIPTTSLTKVADKILSR